MGGASPENRYFPVIYDRNVYLLFSSHVNNAAAVSSVDFPFCADTAIIAAGRESTRELTAIGPFFTQPRSLPVTAKPVVKKKKK